MEKKLSRIALLSLSLLATPFCSAAVSPSHVAADATWIAYADLNAIRSSALGKDLMEMIRKQQAEKTGGLFGVNAPKVMETIGSITAYGTVSTNDTNSANGTLLIQGTPDLKKIAEALLIQQSLEKPEEIVELKDFPFSAYGIEDKSPKATKGAQVIIAFPPEPVILISKSKATLTKALEVFSGNGDSLEKAPAGALKGMIKDAGDSLIFGAGTGFSADNMSSKGKPGVVLKLASSGMIALGENGENTFVRLMLTASSEDTAGKLMKIVQGMTAAMSLAESTDKQLTEFLNSVVVDKQKETVSMKLSYSSVRVSEILKNIQHQSEVRRQKKYSSEKAESKTAAKDGKGE